jgi:alpha-methylacyl-CoA racemase
MPALTGLKIIEIAGIGPAPFAGMMLADHGADVIRVDRPGASAMLPAGRDILLRSRKHVAIDLKSPDGIAVLRDLARGADGLIEGFRPGVMERLGVGPEVLLADNPKLVFGRMTGWGQEGPMAARAGHDIDYIALAGALHAFGRAGEKPVPPVNMVGDFGGGGMLLAFGMLAGLLSAARTGQGQVIDCAMVDGAALLMSMVWSFFGAGFWRDERGVNLLDTGAPFYDTYETADGKYLAVGALEPQFFAQLREVAGLDDALFESQMDFSAWPAMKARLAEIFRTRTRDAWCAAFDGTDACVAPVLSLREAPLHPHNAARATFVEAGGMTQPAPAPRMAGTPAAHPRMAGEGTDTDAVLASLGYDAERIARLRAIQAIG